VVQKSLKSMVFKMGSKDSNVMFVAKYLLIILVIVALNFGLFILKANKHTLNYHYLKIVQSELFREDLIKQMSNIDNLYQEL